MTTRDWNFWAIEKQSFSRCCSRVWFKLSTGVTVTVFIYICFIPTQVFSFFLFTLQEAEMTWLYTDNKWKDTAWGGTGDHDLRKCVSWGCDVIEVCPGVWRHEDVTSLNHATVCVCLSKLVMSGLYLASWQPFNALVTKKYIYNKHTRWHPQLLSKMAFKTQYKPNYTGLSISRIPRDERSKHISSIRHKLRNFERYENLDADVE